MVLNATAYLDTGLPSGSHVVFVGLLPGEMMWNTMAQRAHPSLNPITYGTLWDYLNCLQVQSCSSELVYFPVSLELLTIVLLGKPLLGLPQLQCNMARVHVTTR